MDDSSIFDRYQ